MSPLIDGLPHSILIGDTEYEIETDFRTGMLIEEVLADEWDSPIDMITQIFLLYLGEGISFESADEILHAVKDLMQFYRCGKPVKEKKDDDETEDEAPQGKTPVLSLKHDAEYIYAAFLQTYRIDLFEEQLHWWKFNALLKSLPDDTRMMKIIGYRSEKITSKMSKERKAFLRRMKDVYRLPLEEKEQEAVDKLTHALMTGEGILEALK